MTQSAITIRWHLENISLNIKPSKPYVFARYNCRINQCEVAVYAHTNQHLVASITRSLDNMNLDIVDARVYLMNKDYSLSQFIITSNYNPIESEVVINKISNNLQSSLLDILSIKDLIPGNIRKRDLSSITANSIIKAEYPRNEDYTLLYVKAPDQHGLLANITYGLALSNYTIQYAKINTLAEQAEDYFYICDKDQKPIIGKNRLKSLEIRIHNIINT
jgi:[protein-PII] uridylyltransferase